MDEQSAGNDVRQIIESPPAATPIASPAAPPATVSTPNPVTSPNIGSGSLSNSNSSNSSRRSSTVRRTNSKRKVLTATTTGSTAGAPPPSTLRTSSSDLGEEGSSLTSFPSLSPEASPQAVRLKEKILGKKDGGGKVVGRTLQGGADLDATPRQQAPRMNLVETLLGRTASPSARGRNSLFADSPATTSQDVPGALHHASDDHIHRLVARRGAVALVRQLAGDLAQREAEMTTLKLRAETRERELKRMLREVEVSNLDIEKRLRQAEERDRGPDGKSKSNRNSLGSVGDLVGEAISDSLEAGDEETFLTEITAEDRQATIRAAQLRTESESLSSSVESGKKQGWMNYFLGTSSTVRQRGSSSPSGQEPGSKTTGATGRRRGLDETTFQPFDGEDDRGSSMSRVGSNTSDGATRKVSKSSWTMKLFAGNTSSKDLDTQSVRGRSSTTASDAAKSLRDISRDSRNTTSSATVKRQAKRHSIQSINVGVPAKGDPRLSGSVPLASPAPGEVSENLGPVEMDAILPHGTRPPTLSPYDLSGGPSDVLTDRFGFIYDQRRRKKEAEAMARTAVVDPKRDRETIGNPLGISTAASVDLSGRSATPASFNDIDDADEGTEGSGQPTRKWQDYLKISAFSGELLSQTPGPSSVPVIEAAETTSRKPLKRVPTFGDMEDKTAPNPAPSTTAINANKAELAKPVLSGPNSPALQSGPGYHEMEPVKLLLAQLGELHDKLQREKEVRWNEFMRKVRAERRREEQAAAAAAAAAGGNESRTKSELPEIQIADGEIIGIASLGHKGKVGRAKYREFRSLVLAGIPVVQRAKVWSECSGAKMLRVPGYYQELVESRSEADPSVIVQIDMDINRTLTDNVFFRRGPGVAKLKEVLLAYARRNPEVGYCQGMNLITASLLLIMPTAEDAFWVLASLVEGILPTHYYDSSLLASRADQQVLLSYVLELLPRLGAHLDSLSVELEALTFQWFLSLFTACLSAEALYRVWDVLLCLNQDPVNGGSTFLFQIALALLKLNEPQLLALSSPADIYAYLGGEITNHAISIDGLIKASEGLKALVKRQEVEERRKAAVERELDTIRERERIRNGDNRSTATADS